MELISVISAAVLAAETAAWNPNTAFTAIQTALTSIFGIIVAVLSVNFLVKRQMSQLIQFMALSILVGVLIWSPQILTAVSKWLGTAFGAPAA